MATYIDGLNTYYQYNGEGPLTCPLGWVPVWDHDPADGVLDRPEDKPAGVPQTRTPEGAAAIHNAYSTTNGALVRSFNVGVGEEITASVWMMKVAEENESGCVLAIDPTGQTVLDDGRLVFSDWLSQHTVDWQPSGWRWREVSAIAQSNVVTVFLLHRANYAEHAHSHFDDFQLTTSGIVPPDPPDPPNPPDGTLGELLGELEDALVAVVDYVANNSVQQQVLIV